MSLRAATRSLLSKIRVWHRDDGNSAVGSLASATSTLIRAPSIVYCGETHEQPDVLRAQIALLEAVISSKPRAINVVLEHFTFPEQAALDRFMNSGSDRSGAEDGDVTAEGFRGIHAVLRYAIAAAAEEGVPLQAYAGFPPRAVARKFMSTAESGAAGCAWRRLVDAGWLGQADTALDGLAKLAPGDIDAHYAFFEALLTGEEEADGAAWGSDSGSGRTTGSAPGRGGNTNAADGPAPRSFLHIFPAQTVKDACMALTVARAYADLAHDTGETRPASACGSASAEGIVVVIAGTGHVDFGFGIPERVSQLLGIPARIPTRGDSGVKDAHDQAHAQSSDRGPSATAPVQQCIFTVRPRQSRPEQLCARSPDQWAADDVAPARILFPDGTRRVAGDIVYWYDHVNDDDDDDEGAQPQAAAHAAGPQAPASRS